MSWRRSPWIFSALLGVPLAGCGVKGDPLPPERPPQIGRGRPTYHRATERIKLEPEGEREDDE